MPMICKWPSIVLPALNYVRSLVDIVVCVMRIYSVDAYFAFCIHSALYAYNKQVHIHTTSSPVQAPRSRCGIIQHLSEDAYAQASKLFMITSSAGLCRLACGLAWTS